MAVLVVGMSHQSAPVALLEKLSMDSGIQTQTCTQLVQQQSLSEAMILSTCNRMEVYSVTNSFHTGVQDVVKVLQQVSGIPEAELRNYLYVRYADAAAEHLMTVTSGLDSMVVGEQQIIGQVRSSYQHASEQGTVGPAIHALAQSALHTGKRVHSETAIDEAGASMVSFAYDQALSIMGRTDLQGATVLILGAGAMSSLAATHAGRLGAATLVLANRTRERAERLAEHAREANVAAEVIDFEDRVQALGRVDMVVSATGATEFTVRKEDIPAGAQLMLVDLSMPRDIDDAAAELSGVDVVNIERLASSLRAADTEVGAASSPHVAARKIVNEELAAYTSAQRVRDVVPAVSELRRRAADLVACEIGRLQQKSPDLSPRQLDEVSIALKRVVDKLLHEPTVRAKELAASSGTVSHETALQQLFGLEIGSLDADEEQVRQGVAVTVAELPELSQVTEAASDSPQQPTVPEALAAISSTTLK